MATSAAITAFREKYFDASPLDVAETGDWSDWGARRLRYDVLWAYFQGNAYRTIHTWARKLKADYGLYKYVRDLYNPAYELSAFYRTYVWGGPLDTLAGDGRETPSALPIVTANEALRPAIARVWQWSNWKTKRKLVPLFGSSLGDVFIQVVDDVHREKVYLKVVHPGIVKDVRMDPFGNVKAYTIEYDRPDENGRSATYTETATREGENVIFSQYKSGKLFDWEYDGGEEGPEPERVIPYGFVPMVFIPHNDVGLTWGMAEAQPKLGLFREVDDQVSKLADQIRKLVDSPWFFAGLKRPTSTPTLTGAEASTTTPEPGREEIPALYATDPNAKATPLVAPMPISEVAGHIKDMLGQLEKVYPELALYRVREGTAASGRAVRLIQRDAEGKVLDYRDVYDGALVRAQQMAVAMGGYRQYDGFQGFGLESYASGALDHQIGARPVFSRDPLDDEEEEGVELENQKKAVAAGWSLPVYLKYRNYDEATIQEIVNSPEYQAKLAAMEMLGGNQNG